MPAEQSNGGGGGGSTKMMMMMKMRRAAGHGREGGSVNVVNGSSSNSSNSNNNGIYNGNQQHHHHDHHHDIIRSRRRAGMRLRPRSMHEAVFWRSRLAAAMRTAWACLMAGAIIQLGSMHAAATWVTFPIFAYVMAVTVVGESTLGKAMQDTVAVVTGTLQGVGMGLLLLQLLPPAAGFFANAAVAVGLVAASSFLITYPSSSHILHKRVALAHSGIIYITAAVQQQRMEPVLFPLRLAGTTVVGATCGMLALLLPLPHLAVLQVYSQTKLSARITSERLKVLVDSFTTKDVTQASALSLQAKSLAKLGAAVHAEISSNEGDMGWEVQRFRLRTSQNLQHVTRGLTSLRKTAVGLELALQAGIEASSSTLMQASTCHRQYHGACSSNIAPSKQLLLPERRLNYMMKQSLVYLTDWVALALGHASTDIKHRSASSHTHRQVILEEGNEVLSSFDESLLAARQHQQQAAAAAAAPEHLEYIMAAADDGSIRELAALAGGAHHSHHHHAEYPYTTDDQYSDGDSFSSHDQDDYDDHDDANDADSCMPAYSDRHDRWYYHDHRCGDGAHVAKPSLTTTTATYSSDQSSDSYMLDTMCKTAKKQLASRMAAGEMGGSEPILGEVPTSYTAYYYNPSHIEADHNLQQINGPNVLYAERAGSGSGSFFGGESVAEAGDGAAGRRHVSTAIMAGCGPHKFEAQATAFFFLFNVKMFVQETKSILLRLDQDPKLATAAAAAAAAASPASTSRFMHYISAAHLHHAPADQQGCRAGGAQSQSPLVSIKPIPQDADHHVSGVMQYDLHHHAYLRKLCSKCADRTSKCKPAATDERGNKRSSGGSMSGMWKRGGSWLWRKLGGYLVFRVEREQAMAAFKMALAMAIGAFFGFWFNEKKGYWADITLALGYTGPAKGGSFRVAVLRTLGTVSGSIYGLLVVMATDRFPVVRLLALVPWVVFTSFLRQSKIFGYAGAVSAFTGAIVILARTNKDSSDQEFTVIRIVEAFLGMASFIIVEMLVFPRRAASMVKPEIISGLAKMRQLVSAIFDAFSGGDADCDECGGCSVMEELKAKEKELRGLLSRQNALVKEAGEEPQLWFDAFPGRIFGRLMEQQGKIMEMLHFSMAAMEELKQVGKETKMAMNALLREALGEAMRMMEEKVVPTLEFLEKVMGVQGGGGGGEEQEQQKKKKKLMYKRLPSGRLAAADPFMSPGHGDIAAEAAAAAAAAADMACKGDIESAGNLAELERLMKENRSTRNVMGSKQQQQQHYGRRRRHRRGGAACCDELDDIAMERGRRFMDAFERGVLFVAKELAAVQARAASPSSSSSPSPAAACAGSGALDHLQPPLLHDQAQIITNGGGGGGGDGGFQTLTNTVLLSLGALAFALNGLLHHSSELEKGVHELLQEENPWNLIDFWDTSRSSANLC